MQEINDAWATLNPDKAAKYHDKSPLNVFFDLAPLVYTGRPAFARGAPEVLATLQVGPGTGAVALGDLAAHSGLEIGSVLS